MKRCANEITVIVAATTSAEPEIRLHADMITGSPPTRIYLAETARAVDGTPSIDLTAEIQYLAVSNNAELIVCEWFQNPAILQRLLQLARELKIPTVFIRPGRAVTGGRLVVATGGGSISPADGFPQRSASVRHRAYGYPNADYGRPAGDPDHPPIQFGAADYCAHGAP